MLSQRRQVGSHVLLVLWMFSVDASGTGCGHITYGHHLAVSLAAGLLFLSAGRSSLSTSNEGIAALLIALYPVWPNSPIDQRAHLQVQPSPA
jgi:hypothetical protein